MKENCIRGIIMHNTEADRLRASAEKFDRNGEHVTATLFRNEAWRAEQGREWLDDTREVQP